jgi:enoyl-CoA hydratase
MTAQPVADSSSPEPTASTAPIVLVEDIDGVRIVTLNRPEARNAIDLATAQAIENAIDELEEDPSLRAMIIAANGPAFCAGMDLKAFLRGERPVTKARGFAGLAQHPPTKPIIAAVEGHALAGGFEIVLACDLIVASETATFGLPEVKRGLVAAGGGLLRLHHHLSMHRAMELVLTGAAISATEADRLGLLNRLTPPGQALPVALGLAEVIAANGPLAVAASKQILLKSVLWELEQAFINQHAYAEPVRNSDDAKEGARAFLERRSPVWRGR